MKKKRFFRPDEVAWELGVSKRTVYRLIQNGELLAFSITDGGAVRIPKESIERFTERRTEKYQYDHGIILPGNDKPGHQ